MNARTDEFMFELADVRDADFSAHNAESRALWSAFRARTHDRTPVRLGCNPRVLMLDPQYNTRGTSYEAYMQDPGIMGQAVLEWQYWTRFFLPGDHEKGLPESWNLSIDFENHTDAAWFGCPVHYRDGQVPDTEPILTDDRKRMLFDRGTPDPFGGEWPERCLKFMEHFERRCAEGWSFLGVPVAPPTAAPFMGCDGVFTAAASLRGPTALCMDLLGDPDYAHELLGYVHTALMARMKAWRKHLGLTWPRDDFGTADDSIELISTECYREFVLPLHRDLYETFATETSRDMHLCGNAQRHFVTIREELGVTGFDTGFPVDFGRFRRELGPDVYISCGPAVPFFLQDDAAAMEAEVERIAGSGILDGGRTVFREGNNLPPLTLLSMCETFYEAAKRLGRLDG